MVDLVCTFLGNERWQWPFASPNHLGAVIAVLLVTATAWLSQDGRFPRRLRLAAFGMVIAGLAFVLAHTYSRGGWVAAIGGLALLVLVVPRSRAMALASALILAIAIATTSAGGARLATSVQVQDDASIAHRLEVWRGALQMVGEHPLGVGERGFGATFTGDYQRWTLPTRYETAINDSLHLAAVHGLPLLALLLVLLLAPAIAALHVARSQDDRLIGGLVAAQATLFIAGCFTYLASRSVFPWLWAGIWLATVLLAWRSGLRWRSLLPGAVLGLVLACILAALGAWSANRLPWRFAPAPLPGTTAYIEPRQQAARGLILLLPDAGDDRNLLRKHVLRPLAARGYAVACLAPGAGAEDDRSRLDTAVAAWAPLAAGKPLLVLGHGNGGRTAADALWGDAKRVQGMLLVDPILETPVPVPGRSPHLVAPAMPVAIACSDATPAAGLEPATRIIRRAADAQPESRLIRLEADEVGTTALHLVMDRALPYLDRLTTAGLVFHSSVCHLVRSPGTGSGIAEFECTNRAETPLRIISVNRDCPCFTFSPECLAPIPPGGRRRLLVAIDLTAFPRSMSKTFSLLAEMPGSEPRLVRLEVAVEVQQRISLEPLVLAWVDGDLGPKHVVATWDRAEQVRSARPVLPEAAPFTVAITDDRPGRLEFDLRPRADAWPSPHPQTWEFGLRLDCRNGGSEASTGMLVVRSGEPAFPPAP